MKRQLQQLMTFVPNPIIIYRVRGGVHQFVLCSDMAPGELIVSAAKDGGENGEDIIEMKILLHQMYNCAKLNYKFLGAYVAQSQEELNRALLYNF